MPRLAAILSAFGLAAMCLAAAVVQLSGSERQWMLMVNTLQLAAGVAAVSVPGGTLLAVLLVRTDLPGRRVLALLLGAMLFVPLYWQAAAWQVAFRLVLGVRGGGLAAAVWIHGLALVPWVVLIVGGALRFVEPELEEEALLWGSAWQVLWRVTLRRVGAAVGVATLLAVLNAAGEMTVTDLFQVRTYAEELYTGFALGDEWAAMWRDLLPGGLLAAALLLAAGICVVSVPPALQAALRPAIPFRLGSGRWFAGAAGWLVGGVIVGVPVASLLYEAGSVAMQSGDARWHEWSAIHLLSVFSRCVRDFQSEFTWSLLIGAAAATCGLLAAIPLAWRARRGGRRAGPALVLAALCLATPGPLAGLAVIGLLNRPSPEWFAGLYNRTIAAPVLALMVRVLPVALLIGWYAFRSLADDVLEAAACDGAGPVTRLVRIALPQRWAQLGVAWLAAFAVAVGDLACSILVVPPGVTTVPIRVFGFIHTGVDDLVAGLCLTALALYGGVACLAAWQASRKT